MSVSEKFQLIFLQSCFQGIVSWECHFHGARITHYETSCPDWVILPINKFMWGGDALNYWTSKETTDKLSYSGGREYLLQRERFDFITPALPFTWASHTGLLFLLMLSAFKSGRGLVSQSIRSSMYKNIFPVMLCRKYGPRLRNYYSSVGCLVVAGLSQYI